MPPSCYAFLVPRFDPFAGLRYATDDVTLDDLIAPPYDVISQEERAKLVARTELNSVRLELPVDEDGRDRYDVAAGLLRAWRSSGVLAADRDPTFYVYRMGYHDEAGRPRQTTGVIGALELSAPGEGGILPHERTTPKDKADRLALLRACRANLSPIWVLSPAAGLSEVCEPSGPPDARATDDEGVHHRLWRVDRPAVLEAISGAVASAPVIVADGHHRYETALAYREERRRAHGGGDGAYGAVMAYVVELAEEQLDIRPIHRLLSGLPVDFDPVEALAAHFELLETGPPGGDVAARMEHEGALCLVTPGGAWLLRPTRATETAARHALDSSRLEVALARFPTLALAFQHGVENVLRAVRSGAAQAGVLLRPATVRHIAAIADGAERMPPKTTFFSPKPRTGMVFREVPG